MAALKSSLSPVKFLLFTVLSVTVLVSITSAAYTGLRYGKRESSETIGRLLAPRSGGVRNIQARSSGVRFYPGTRFGGKRSYWQPAPVMSDTYENSDLPPSNLPYDCVHVPFVGVRCSRVDGETYWNNMSNDEDQMMTNEGSESGSPSFPAAQPASSSTAKK